MRSVQRTSKDRQWKPFQEGWPAGWYDRFRKSLAEDPNAERIRKYFIPKSNCDFFKVGAFAMAYVWNSQCCTRERADRLENDLKDLFAEQRRLEKELYTDAALIPSEFGTGAGARLWKRAIENKPKLDQLTKVKEGIEIIRHLTGEKDLRWLWMIKTYLEAASGSVEVYAKDLAALLDAAYIAGEQKRRLDHDENKVVEKSQLLQNMRRFEKRNPIVVKLIKEEALRLKKSISSAQS